MYSRMPEDNPGYLTSQLITCLGNKRALLGFIGKGLSLVQQSLGKERLKCFDVFSGSGVVARFLKRYSSFLAVNDLELYSEVINRCYLANVPDLPLDELRNLHDFLRGRLDGGPLKAGLISRLYAPADDGNIQPGERVFYTGRNARYIDTARQLIGAMDETLQPCFLAPLLSEASIHANTAGVFKGFYKCRETGIGRFGGTRGDALRRIQGPIELPFPVFSRFNCDVHVFRSDANTLAKDVPEVDLAYVDPPYNQHPYGSNYFMLNLIARYEEPENISRVSGIPANWNRSEYNRKRHAAAAFADLASQLKARFLLVSFNSEGFISRREMTEILNRLGRVKVLETRYNTFRGSRNLKNRETHVKEYLYLVQKKR